MTKIMFMAFAAVCAFAVSANTVQWNTGTIYGPGEGGVGFGDDPVAPGSSGYLATLYVFTDAEMQNAVELTGNSGSVITGDSTIEGETGDSLAGGVYYGYMEIIANGNTLRSAGFSFEVSDMMGYGAIYLGDGGDGITPISGSLDDDYGAWSTSGWSGGGGVPEPTSGLLLLIGGSLLALRRKRA